MNWFCRYVWHRWLLQGFNRRRRVCRSCGLEQQWLGAMGWQDDPDVPGYGWGV